MPDFTLTDKLLLVLYIVILCAAYVLYALWAVKLVRLQMAYHKSHVLVRLRSNKLWYVLLIAVLAVIMGVFIDMAVKGKLFKEAVIFSLLVGGFMLVSVMLAFTKSGIVDGGVFNSNRFIPWSKCYDYYVDMTKYTIAFSNNIKGGLTLVGTTFPKKFRQEDTDALMKILEEKKDQFLTNIIIR